MAALADLGARIEFVYTDISPQLVTYGRNTYGPTYPFATFKLLDVEKDTEEQVCLATHEDLHVMHSVIVAVHYVNWHTQNSELGEFQVRSLDVTDICMVAWHVRITLRCHSCCLACQRRVTLTFPPLTAGLWHWPVRRAVRNKCAACYTRYEQYPAALQGAATRGRPADCQ